MPDPTHENSIRAARLENFRALVIGGSDRAEFLQGQLTQDVDKLGAAGTALAGWTNAKGRLLAFGQLLAVGDEIRWLLPADIVDGVARRMGLFVLRADVSIAISDEPVAGLLGIGAVDELEISGESVRLDNGSHRLGDGSLIVRVTGDPDRAWLIGPAAGNIGFESADPTDWTLASIRAGLPDIVAATQEQFVPQMLNLDELGAISFDKGCYVGQEIVARTQNLGRIKRRMYGYSGGEGLQLAPGATIHGPGNATGKVVLAVGCDESTELLAVVAIDQAQGDWYADQDQLQPLAPVADA